MKVPVCKYIYIERYRYIHIYIYIYIRRIPWSIPSFKFFWWRFAALFEINPSVSRGRRYKFATPCRAMFLLAGPSCSDVHTQEQVYIYMSLQGVLSIEYSVFSIVWSILYWVLVLGIQYSVLSIQYSVFSSIQYSVLGVEFSIQYTASNIVSDFVGVPCPPCLFL